MGWFVNFSFKGTVGKVAHFIMLVGIITPPPLTDTMYIIEYNVKPSELPIGINNFGNVVFFVTVLVVVLIVGPNFDS